MPFFELVNAYDMLYKWFAIIKMSMMRMLLRMQLCQITSMLSCIFTIKVFTLLPLLQTEKYLLHIPGFFASEIPVLL